MGRNEQLIFGHTDHGGLEALLRYMKWPGKNFFENPIYIYYLIDTKLLNLKFHDALFLRARQGHAGQLYSIKYEILKRGIMEF